MIKKYRVKKIWIYITVPITLIILLFLLFNRKTKEELVFGKIVYGNIVKTISCTGTLNAKGTVEVGSRISGTISKLYADYNDSVSVNMVMGVLDTVLLSKESSENMSLCDKARYKYLFSKKEYENAKELYKNKYISYREYNNYKTNFLVDSADYKYSKLKLDKSNATLEYAIIRSPINGIVIDRNVEEGQTIAANFTTPVLYVIAKDLHKMEILVTVDESDIGSIKVGQKAKFTVNAYPDSTFWGKVNEIRIKPNITQNVVTYIIVVDAENPHNYLLPGMTATVDFIVEEKKNVLIAPLSAIRFKPSNEMMIEYKRRLKINEKINMIGWDKSNINKNNKSIPSQIWYIDNNGEISMEQIIIGGSDENNIEIKKYDKKILKNGMNIIIGVKEKNNKKSNTQNKNSNQILGPTMNPPGGGAGPP
jgi:HlyD family secretion protein